MCKWNNRMASTLVGQEELDRTVREVHALAIYVHDFSLPES